MLTYIATYGIGENLLGLEGVDGEHCHIADEEEGDDLTAGFAAIVLRQVDAATGHVRDEQQLKDNLEHRNGTGGGHQKMRLTYQEFQTARNHTEHGIDEEAKGRYTQKDIVQIRLFFAAEL